MSVLGILLDDCVEVSYCLLMPVNHLISFSSFMDVPDVMRYPLNAFSKWKDSLLKLLLSAVRQTYVVVDIRLIGWEWVAPKSILKRD